MSEPYVPTTEEFRAAWMVAGPPSQTVVRAWQFERGMDAHDREVAERAWDEGVSALLTAHRWSNAEPWIHLTDNPYRIEGQETP